MKQEFETRYASLGHSGKMAADVFGNGEAVVLIHGIPGGPGAWHPVAGKLARSHRVIVPHLLGFNESARPTKSITQHFVCKFGLSSQGSFVGECAVVG